MLYRENENRSPGPAEMQQAASFECVGGETDLHGLLLDQVSSSLWYYTLY